MTGEGDWEMKKTLSIATCLLLTACSDPGTSDWIGVIDSKVAPPYADFSTQNGTFKTFPDCERAMKAAAGDQQEMPRAGEGFVVRTLFYRCKQGKEEKTARLVATKYLLLPASP